MFLGRIVKTGEPVWLEDDRLLALALAEWEADQHTRCGQPLSETTAVDEHGKPIHHYQALPPYQCGACVELDATRKDYEEHPHLHALVFEVARVT